MRIFIIFLTIFLYSCVDKQENKETTLQKSRIKIITCLGYKPTSKKGKISIDTLTSKATFKYDKNGNLTEANYYDLKTNLVFSSDKREYDKRGNMIKTTFYNSSGKVVGIDIYKYDNKNNQIQKDNYWNGKLNGRLIRTYNYKSMIVIENIFDAVGKLQSKYSYKIDNNGNHLEDYDYNGKLYSKSTFQYDNKGNKIKEHSEAWELDTTNDVIGYQYDEHNNEILRTITNLNKNIKSSVKTEYVYNKFGDWTKQMTTWSWSADRQTEKREIEYFEK